MASEVVLDRDGVDDELEALGAKVTRNALVHVLAGPPPVFVATCALADAKTGEVLGEWEGEAYPGDSQSPSADEGPDMPTNRAKIRARREALYQLRRLRQGWREQPQHAHVRDMMAIVRTTAKRLNMTDEALHLIFHVRHKLDTLNDVTSWQAKVIIGECAELVAQYQQEANRAHD